MSTEKAPQAITSGWFAIIIQVVIVTFYGGGLLVNINQNSAHIKDLQADDTDSRVKVIETKMLFYDRIIDKMDIMSDNIQEMRLQINDLQNKSR